MRRPDHFEICGYCGISTEAFYLEPISVTRNGKTREMWRCDKCADDMHKDHQEHIKKAFKESSP